MHTVYIHDDKDMFNMTNKFTPFSYLTLCGMDFFVNITYGV